MFFSLQQQQSGDDVQLFTPSGRLGDEVGVVCNACYYSLYHDLVTFI